MKDIVSEKMSHHRNRLVGGGLSWSDLDVGAVFLDAIDGELVKEDRVAVALEEPGHGQLDAGLLQLVPWSCGI